MTSKDFSLKPKTFFPFWSFFLCDAREFFDEQKRYSKAPFDSDKIYQLISEIVDKTFLTDDEEDPYVSCNLINRGWQGFGKFELTSLKERHCSQIINQPSALVHKLL